MRPIASGALVPGTALAWAAVLSAAARWRGVRAAAGFGVVAAAYLALFVVYTRALKHVVILDVMSIAIGFVLRAVAGGLVIGVPISDWLLVCTILGALFLGLAKRRHEIDAAGRRAPRDIAEFWRSTTRTCSIR